MTLQCLDCGSHSIHDLADDWKSGKVPCCPHCRAPLFDEVGKPLAVEADKGWCHNPHRHATLPTTSFRRFNWDWRSRDLFDHRELLPVGERAEMAANAEPSVDEEGR